MAKGRAKASIVSRRRTPDQILERACTICMVICGCANLKRLFGDTTAPRGAWGSLFGAYRLMGLRRCYKNRRTRDGPQRRMHQTTLTDFWGPNFYRLPLPAVNPAVPEPPVDAVARRLEPEFAVVAGASSWFGDFYDRHEPGTLSEQFFGGPDSDSDPDRDGPDLHPDDRVATPGASSGLGGHQQDWLQPYRMKHLQLHQQLQRQLQQQRFTAVAAAVTEAARVATGTGRSSGSLPGGPPPWRPGSPIRVPGGVPPWLREPPPPARTHRCSKPVWTWQAAGDSSDSD